METRVVWRPGKPATASVSGTLLARSMELVCESETHEVWRSKSRYIRGFGYGYVRIAGRLYLVKREGVETGGTFNETWYTGVVVETVEYGRQWHKVKREMMVQAGCRVVPEKFKKREAFGPVWGVVAGISEKF